MAGSFDVDIREIAALATKVAGAQPIVKKNLHKAARAAGFAVQGNAIETAPVKTGHLKGKISTKPPRQSGISTTVDITSHADYSAAVHDGRKEVRPASARVLAWHGKDGMVFSMKSKAVAANPFMDRGLKSSEGQITMAFDQALANALREMGL